MSASPYRRSCEELAVCQGRGCSRCAHPFAPGAIERHRSQHRRTLHRALARAAVLMAAVVVIAFVFGYATGA